MHPVRLANVKKGIYLALLILYFMLHTFFAMYGLVKRTGDVFLETLPLVFVTFLYLTFRVLSPKFILLWFRKFDEPLNDGFDFKEIFKDMSDRNILCVTLQDSTVKESREHVSVQFLVMAMLLIATFFTIFLIFKDQYTVLIRGLKSFDVLGFEMKAEIYVFTAVFLVWSLFSIPAVYFVFNVTKKNKSYFDALKVRNRQSISRKLYDIVSGFRIFKGIFVIRCDDVSWRETVTQVLGIADVVIVDLDKLNVNLAWEIKQSLHYLPPESIIFTTSQEGVAENGFDSDSFKELTAFFEPNYLKRIPVFQVPEKLKWYGFSLSHRAHLRQLITDAIGAKKRYREFETIKKDGSFP